MQWERIKNPIICRTGAKAKAGTASAQCRHIPFFSDEPFPKEPYFLSKSRFRAERSRLSAARSVAVSAA